MKDEGAASGIQAGQPLDGLAAFHYSLLTTHYSYLNTVWTFDDGNNACSF